LTPVQGDPEVVYSTGRTLSSIAAEIATTATQLRALATADPRSEVHWTGTAAVQAYARAITLPPKLDKARASYADAGTSLTGYANALAAAQAEANAAIRAADAAEIDLAVADTARRQAAASDAAAAAAAIAASKPVPPPTAPRYDAAIADAQGRIRRAVDANQAAHDRQRAAAKTAAGALHTASRAGIANKKWWQHAIAAVGHWASTAWTDSLRFISKTATVISALAGIAALVVAVVGIFFPPAEVVAAALESVALAAASIAAVADVALAVTGKGSWTTVGWDALSFAPTGAAKLLRKFAPTIRDIRLFKPTTVAHASTRPVSRVGEAVTVVHPVLPGSNETWANPATLPDHFERHGHHFGASSAGEYSRMASGFFKRGVEQGLPTKIADDGSIRIFDEVSNTFGSYDRSGRTRTFFKPTSSTYWERQPGTLIKELTP
jgi:hypothetical protein